MKIETQGPRGSWIFDEMREFAGFPAATQRYIRRSLDVGLGRRNVIQRWARDEEEATSIRSQAIVYMRLDDLCTAVAHCGDLASLEDVMAPLIAMTAFDLGEGRIDGFSSYRFLYERLMGAAARPFLPGAFCAAATLPHLHPETRRRLLRTVNEGPATAIGWSSREPTFMPEWVDKVEATAG